MPNFDIPELDPEIKKIIEDGMRGPDRSKEKPSPGTVDIQKEEEKRIYGPIREKEKRKKEREANKTKRSARESELAELADMRRSGIHNPSEAAGEILAP